MKHIHVPSAQDSTHVHRHHQCRESHDRELVAVGHDMLTWCPAIMGVFGSSHLSAAHLSVSFGPRTSSRTHTITAGNNSCQRSRLLPCRAGPTDTPVLDTYVPQPNNRLVNRFWMLEQWSKSGECLWPGMTLIEHSTIMSTRVSQLLDGGTCVQSRRD